MFQGKFGSPIGQKSIQMRRGENADLGYFCRYGAEAAGTNKYNH